MMGISMDCGVDSFMLAFVYRHLERDGHVYSTWLSC